MKTNKIKNYCDVDLDELKGLKNQFSNLHHEEELNQKTEIFKALADPTRLQILYLLYFRDLYVCELAELLEKPQSPTSHHLSILKNVGLIKSSKEGIWILYKLKTHDIITFADNLCETVQR
jgi:ArsR family transcriptional regulator